MNFRLEFVIVDGKYTFPNHILILISKDKCKKVNEIENDKNFTYFKKRINFEVDAEKNYFFYMWFISEREMN